MADDSDEEKKEAENKIWENIVRDELPELWEIGVDNFYRGFEDKPEYVIPPEMPYRLSPIDKFNLLKIDPNGKYKNKKFHVMLVGRPSSGKTAILSRVQSGFFENRVAQLVFKKNIICTIDIRRFRGDERVSISDFLFRDVDPNGDFYKVKDKFNWLKEGSFETAFFVDNLDKTQFFVKEELNAADVRKDTVSTPGTFLFLIFSGDLFPGCKILSSTRPHRANILTGKARPDRIVLVGEMTEETMSTLSLAYVGKSCCELVVNYWNNKSHELSVLNKTAGMFMYNMMALRSRRRYQTPLSLSEVMLELLVSSADVICSVRGLPVRRDNIFHGIKKLQKLAYRGISRHQFVFTVKDINECGFIPIESDICSLAYPTGLGSVKRLLLEWREDKYIFIDHGMQEFLCSLYVLQLPMEEYDQFVTNNFHKQYYYNIRRMVYGLLFNDNLNELMEMDLIPDGVTQRTERQKLLVERLASQYADNPPKRHDFLELLLTLSETPEWMNAEILPEAMDTIDLSDIPLFRQDMMVIGKMFDRIRYVGHLNLSNCNIGGKGFEDLIKLVEEHQPKVVRFTIDWCREWGIYVQSLEFVATFVKSCCVEDFGSNHCELHSNALQAFSGHLGTTKLKTLRIARNSNLEDFQVLGDFLVRHRVKHLYLSYKDLDPKRMEAMYGGMKKYYKTAAA